MIEIELYNLVSITHNPNIVGPTKSIWLGFLVLFPSLKNLNLGDGN